MIGTTIGLYFGGFAYLLFDKAGPPAAARTEFRSDWGKPKDAIPDWRPQGLDLRR